MGSTLKNNKKIIIWLTGLATLVLCVLPFMSAYVAEGESATFMIRGFNLIEFSPWGCIPIMAGVLIPLIMFSGQTRPMQEAELLLLLVGNAVCYIHSLRAAGDWLLSIGGTSVSLHWGIGLYPLAFLAAFVLAKAYVSSKDQQ